MKRKYLQISSPRPETLARLEELSQSLTGLRGSTAGNGVSQAAILETAFLGWASSPDNFVCCPSCSKENIIIDIAEPGPVACPVCGHEYEI